MSGPRYVIGIDLGTTNSAVAYADLRDQAVRGVPRVRVFDVPQLAAPGEVTSLPTLPSFLYLLSAEDRASGRFALPWAPDPAEAVGVWARDQGALVPGRLVSSAKSWLCHDAVDRRARILPWGGDDPHDGRSPVEASTAYVAHVQAAWNHCMASGPAGEAARFDRQMVVLTVPASFDEEARELTVEAARVEHLALVEEPTAALYAWIAARQGRRLSESLRDGDHLLVCDVGGGTTDFTLVSVRFEADGEPRFERTAVGTHLLLGGDNLDLAIVRHVEEKLGRPRLTLRQQQALRRQCADAKERLLGPPPVERVAVSVLGAGASVVGGALSTAITRDEVLALLVDGFLPPCGLDASPVSERRAGLRELGLPFAGDAAITRHLAAFLRTAGGEAGPVRPDVVLFNGGFFTPHESRDRLASIIASWFDGQDQQPAWAPRVLANGSPATAVAEGAAYFGLVRHGLGVRIGGGSPRAYFLALGDGSPAGDAPRAICVLPRGAQEDTAWRIEDRAFTVATNRPLSFTLLSSLTAADAVGDIVDGGAPALHRHSPLVTELRFGKRTRQADVRVLLEVRFTELGTLELWLAAPDTGHRWRLRFQVRASTSDAAGGDETGAGVDAGAIEGARALLRATFGADPASPPDTLMARLEATLGFGKHAWPLSAVRPLADLLIELVEGRARSAAHEARWLNLFGYCLRPGFGAVLDDWRMTQARRLYLAGLAFPADVQCQSEWLVLWQRLAGGLTPGQQQEMFDRHVAVLGMGGRKARRLPPQVERETVRLLASLEHVPAARRAALGDDLLARWRKDRRNATLLWAIGRVGARVPLHGPLNTVVPPLRTQAWLEALLGSPLASDEFVDAVAQLGARTGDPARDLDEELCARAHAQLVAAGAPASSLLGLVEIHARSARETMRAYGESLPEGLRLAGGA
ncbi:MAG: hsp70 family protein [Vicinamibacterales bacterium]|nr:hsp70 family protein [Vicinamibacterales bacterium]